MAGSIVDSLWSLVSPRSAEAKIVGGPQEMADLGAVQRANAAQRGQYLPDQYQRVIAAAQAHPETVTLQAMPGMMREWSPADPQPVPMAASYDVRGKRILYDPGLPKGELPNTLAHELVHFLNYHRARQQGIDAQHALIKQFLGRDVYDPTTSLQGYQPGAFSPVEHSIINEWLGGPRDWPR